VKEKIPISVVVVAKNEEKNIATCLESVKWADEIIVLDDFSSDGTVEIAKRYTDKVFQRKMDVEGIHRNFAYSKAKNEWVLSLDADEMATPELRDEIMGVLKKGTDCNAFSIPLRNYIGDYWVRYGGWYPAAKLRLFKKRFFKYEEVEVHPRAFLEGKCGHLKCDIIHKGCPNFAHFLNSLNRQTTLEAKKWFNERRKIGLAKALYRAWERFMKAYIQKRGYKDGFVGFMVAILSGFYQLMSYAKYWEMKSANK